jgi:hypothetical protein
VEARVSRGLAMSLRPQDEAQWVTSLLIFYV